MTLGFIFSAMALSASAMDVGGYRLLKQRAATLPPDQAIHAKKTLETYLTGIAETDYAVLSYLDYKEKKDNHYHVYSCPPNDLVFNSGLAERMIDDFLKEHPKVQDTENVPLLYISQMAKVYPCD